MARQQTFVLYPESSELTTKQAAELLGVSRPFLIGILESGAIPHRKIGRHRRVLMKDVLAYKKTMQVNGRAALDELVKASEDAGGYDLARITTSHSAASCLDPALAAGPRPPTIPANTSGPRELDKTTSWPAPRK